VVAGPQGLVNNMQLPKPYNYLKKETGNAIIDEALKLYGTHEIKGPENANPVIIGWAKELGGAVSGWYKSDDEAWCGLFAAICMKRAGYQPPKGFDALRALKYAAWGVSSPGNIPMLGDVMVFARKGGGHVGFYVGEDKTAYHVLGGNQSDTVSIARIARGRLTASRRPDFKGGQAHYIRRIVLNEAGLLSENEA